MLIDGEKFKKKLKDAIYLDDYAWRVANQDLEDCRVPMKSPIKAEEKMSKKILVIEDDDWEKLEEFIKDKATYWASVNRIMEKLESYERKDAIQFEGTVGLGLHHQVIIVPSGYENKIKFGDQVTCIIFRKEE